MHTVFKRTFVWIASRSDLVAAFLLEWKSEQSINLNRLIFESFLREFAPVKNASYYFNIGYFHTSVCLREMVLYLLEAIGCSKPGASVFLR